MVQPLGLALHMGLPLALLAVTSQPATHGPLRLTRVAEMYRGARVRAAGVAAAVDLAAISMAAMVSAELIEHAGNFHVVERGIEVKAPRNSFVPWVPIASRSVLTRNLDSSRGIIGLRVMPGRGKPIAQ